MSKTKYIFRNEDNKRTMKHMYEKGIQVDCVLTSPPYNISRRVGNKQRQLQNREKLYKYYDDTKSWQEYEDFIIKTIRNCFRIIKDNGCMLMNLSYATNVETGASATNMIKLVTNACDKLNLELADIICWKKKSALPNNRNKNKCTRICEFVFVLCRKSEYTTFESNKISPHFINDHSSNCLK